MRNFNDNRIELLKQLEICFVCSSFAKGIIWSSKSGWGRLWM